MAETKAKPKQYLGTGRRKTSVARVPDAEEGGLGSKTTLSTA